MTTLTSALNYGALITLSCCNAVLQIAAAPACTEPAQDSGWLACASDDTRADGGWPRKLLRPDRAVLVDRIDGGRVCPDNLPGDRGQRACGAHSVRGAQWQTH
jgi:hypothetical protein